MMQCIHRALQEPIAEKLNQDNRLVLLLEPRQAGKTTLAKAVMDEVAGGEYLLLSGEVPRILVTGSSSLSLAGGTREA